MPKLAGMEKTENIRAEMERHYRAWQQSGQNKRAYSRDQGLSYYKFIYWITKFGAESSSGGGFTEVSLPAGPYHSPQVEIEYPSGAKVRFYHSCPPALIKSLL